jgi:hypothetical protein
VQLVDDKQKPVLDVVSMEWNGYTNAGSLSGYAPYDLAARASTPRHWLWSNAIARCISLIPLPHFGNGWITTRTNLRFPMPRDYDLDAAAMGLTGISWTATYSAWTDPKTGNEFNCGKDTFGNAAPLLISIDPGWLASSPTTLKIILRHKRFPPAYRRTKSEDRQTSSTTFAEQRAVELKHSVRAPPPNPKIKNKPAISAQKPAFSAFAARARSQKRTAD